MITPAQGILPHINAQFDSTGRMIQTTAMYEDLQVPLITAKVPGSAGPDWVQFMDDGASSPSTGVFAHAFDAGTEEQVYFNTQLPHGWKAGTAISPHVHWSPSNTNTGTVSWGLEYTVQNVDGTFPASVIVYANDAGSGTAKDHQIAAFSDITMTGKTLSCMLVCRFFRDATGVGGTDNYNADAWAHEFDFHIQMDALGSRQEYVK